MFIQPSIAVIATFFKLFILVLIIPILRTTLVEKEPYAFIEMFLEANLHSFVEGKERNSGKLSTFFV